MSGDIIHNVSDSWKSRAEAAETAHRQLEVQYLQDTTELTRRVSEQVRRAEAAEALVTSLAKQVDAEHARAEAAEAKASMSWSEVERLDVELATAEAKIDRLSCWIVEADAAFNTDNKPAESLDDCLGLVRMCHEGAAALQEVQKQQAEIERLRAALVYVYDWLPGAVGSGAVYDKLRCEIGAALRSEPQTVAVEEYLATQ